MTESMLSGSGIPLVCPLCHGTLALRPEQVQCLRCGQPFGYEQGYPDLIVGGRFEDEPNLERSIYEEQSNEYTTQHYLLPTFRKLFPDPAKRRRLLSLGCGTGADVDLLTAAGFEMAGVDCGNRCEVWPRRANPDRLHLANGKNLPFEDSTFDAVYCGCVFPHVGTEGEAHRVLPHYWEERSAIAREMCRVLKPDGYILVSSPNRLCPIDIFHGRSKENPFPRLNSPANPFLLSAADYERLFGQAGCNLFRLLPVEGYWGFINMRTHWKGRLLSAPVRLTFRLVSTRALSFARSLPVSPWLVALMRKSQAW
jgi:SAM-dependent methyltransferase